MDILERIIKDRNKGLTKLMNELLHVLIEGEEEDCACLVLLAPHHMHTGLASHCVRFVKIHRHVWSKLLFDEVGT